MNTKKEAIFKLYSDILAARYKMYLDLVNREPKKDLSWTNSDESAIAYSLASNLYRNFETLHG